MIIERPRRRGYQLHAEGSPEAEVLFSERGLTRAHLDQALAALERTEGIQIRTIVGINDDGVFGSRREGWQPDLPDACAEPFIPVLWLPGPGAARARAQGQHRSVPRGRHPAGRRPAGQLQEVTMDTDQLEHEMNELGHEWMSGKAPTDGVFGTVQAAARVFIFQALSAWTVLEATGQTEQLAPNFESWLRSILETEIPYVRSIASVKASFPKH
jgi:hypothetical protein